MSRRRVDRQAAGIADICDMIEHLQSVDKAAASLATAPQLEADETAIATLQIGVVTLLRAGSRGKRLSRQKECCARRGCKFTVQR
jgi:hypothetical protein